MCTLLFKGEDVESEAISFALPLQRSAGNQEKTWKEKMDDWGKRPKGEAVVETLERQSICNS